MNYLKLIIAAAALLAAYAFGHSVASDKGDVALNKAKAEFSKERTQWADERTEWAHERAEINEKALKSLQDAYDKAAQQEKELRSGFRKAEKQYQLRIKELENARTQADTLIADNGPDGGLWASVEAATCRPTSDSGNASSLPKASGSTSGLTGALQCRLTTKVAQALVQITGEADKKTELLNKCIDTLKVPVEVMTSDPAPQSSDAVGPTK